MDEKQDPAIPTPVNRRQLYALVWSEPMRSIAQRFGISDVGLAKLCARFNIPTPKAGYWAKARHGKKLRQIPLPSSPIDGEFEILSPRKRKTHESQPPLPDDIAAAISALEQDAIVLPKAPSPHPIIEGWASKERIDTLRNEPYRIIGPRVEAVERRRRRFLTLLFREIEKRGGKIRAMDHQKFDATLAGESVDFSVRERYKQERRDATDEERRSSYFGDRRYVTETKPTGTLKLELDTYLTTWAKKRWDDRDALPLENQLAAILTNLYVAASDARRRRLEHEEAERLRYQRQHEEWATEKRERAERERVESLIRDVTNWERAECIRRFVAARTATHGVGTDAAPVLDAWAAWALAAADRMDPLSTRA
jgi:hypothetical protein